MFYILFVLIFSQLFSLKLAQLENLCNYEVGYDRCELNYSQYNNSSLPSTRFAGGLIVCTCDEECNYFGDCCIDANVTADYKSIAKPVCKEVTSQQFVYVVNSCPANWINDAIEDRCKTVKSLNTYPYNEIDEDLFLNEMYVYSNETKLLYNNIFCAHCNNDTRNIVTFDLGLGCESELVVSSENLPSRNRAQRSLNILDLNFLKQKANYSGHSARPWLITNDQSIYSCNFTQNSLEKFLHEEPDKYRKCNDAIESCSSDWKSETIRNKCHSYTSYVTALSDSRIYKNVDCAVCNRVTGAIICENKMETTARKSFTKLLDLQFSAGNIIGSEKDDCFAGQVYIPILKRCIEVGCSKHFNKDPETGKCVIKQSAVKGNGIKIGCPTITIESSFFVPLNQTHIYVSFLSKVYNESEYEFRDGNRSIVVCIEDDFEALPINWSQTETVLTYTCLIASVLCLSLHLVVYAIIPSLRTTPGKIVISLSLSLLVAHITFLTSTLLDANHNDIRCVANSVFMHYFYLSSFFWMNVMSFDLFNVFKQKTRDTKTSSTLFAKYSLFAWLSPLIIVIVCLANEYLLESNDYQALYGLRMCWINQRKALLVFFATPLIIILLTNFIFFILTVKQLLETKRQTNVIRDKKQYIRFKLYLKIAVIIGFTWAFGFIASFNGISWLWYPFIILNGLQGVFIFLSFTFKRETYNSIREITKSKSSKTPVASVASNSRSITNNR